MPQLVRDRQEVVGVGPKLLLTQQDGPAGVVIREAEDLRALRPIEVGNEDEVDLPGLVCLHHVVAIDQGKLVDAVPDLADLDKERPTGLAP